MSRSELRTDATPNEHGFYGLACVFACESGGHHMKRKKHLDGLGQVRRLHQKEDMLSPCVLICDHSKITTTSIGPCAIRAVDVDVETLVGSQLLPMTGLRECS